jgi:mRNA interferase MazF
MTVRRGDVVLAWFPFASGQGAKRRPRLIIQNDEDNKKLGNTIIAQITSTLRRTGDKSHVLVSASTPDGRQSGLLHDSLISATIWRQSNSRWSPK